MGVVCVKFSSGCIQIARGRGRKSGRLITAFGHPRGSDDQQRSARIGFSTGEFPNGIAFSVGSEFIVGHWSARFLFRPHGICRIARRKINF
jgi:hypothetical protein